MNAAQNLTVTETKKMVFLLLFCGILLEKKIKTEYICITLYVILSIKNMCKMAEYI